jgi:protein SCO1/2
MKSPALIALGLFCALPAALAEPRGAEACCSELAGNKALPDRSLYHLDSKWTADDGREQSLSSLRGRPQVMVMFFATCEYACPILVENLKAIERTLPETLRGRVGFLLVSIDPDRDTSEVLHAYRIKHGFASPTWTLLRGRTDDVRELAAVLGIQYQRDARGQFSHSNVISVLDTEGVVAFQQSGLNKDPRETMTALEKLQSPEPR